MQKKLIIAAVIILLIAGAAYIQLSKSPKTPGTTTAGEQKNQTAEAVKGTIEGLLSAGKSVTCTVKNSDAEGSGTVFVSDKKMRGDFTSKLDDKNVETHVIQDGTYSYIWTSDQPQGIKMKLDAVDKKALEDQTKDLNLDKEVGLNCSPWIVDGSKFVPPSNIQFADLSEMLNKVQKDVKNVKDAGKGVCDMIPDAAAKADCLDSLSGN